MSPFFLSNINIIFSYHMVHVYFLDSSDTDTVGRGQRERNGVASFGPQMEGGREERAFKGQCHFPLSQDSLSLAREIIDLKLLQSQPIEKWNSDESSCWKESRKDEWKQR